MTPGPISPDAPGLLHPGRPGERDEEFVRAAGIGADVPGVPVDHFLAERTLREAVGFDRCHSRRPVQGPRRSGTLMRLAPWKSVKTSSQALAEEKVSAWLQEDTPHPIHPKPAVLMTAERLVSPPL
jgi:hypothetical protein